MEKRKIAVLIPAHNEEKVIGSTLLSLLPLLPLEDVYVVDDGSEDQTSEIARKMTPNVLTLSPNVGKATAMNKAITEFNLTSRYSYIMPLDADTHITSDFLSKMIPVLEGDTKKEIACVVGKVVGRKNGWVTQYRIWEYEVSQTIHKEAQGIEGAILVCPGCATIFRSSVFEKIKIPTGTLTEDMDFTFLLHRKRLGKIVFHPEGYVITQDPRTLADFIKQIQRWYVGFWQCVLKHHVPWGGQMLDVEVALLALEGLFNGLLMIFFIVLLPFAIKYHPQVLLAPFFFDVTFFLVPTMLLTLVRQKTWSILFFIPHFYLLRFISSVMFLLSFMKVVLGIDLRMKWGKAKRYAISKEEFYVPTISSH